MAKSAPLRRRCLPSPDRARRVRRQGTEIRRYTQRAIRQAGEVVDQDGDTLQAHGEAQEVALTQRSKHWLVFDEDAFGCSHVLRAHRPTGCGSRRAQAVPPPQHRLQPRVNRSNESKSTTSSTTTSASSGSSNGNHGAGKSGRGSKPDGGAAAGSGTTGSAGASSGSGASGGSAASGSNSASGAGSTSSYGGLATYGRPAAGGDKAAVLAAFHSDPSAIGDGNWAKACTLLSTPSRPSSSSCWPTPRAYPVTDAPSRSPLSLDARPRHCARSRSPRASSAFASWATTRSSSIARRSSRTPRCRWRASRGSGPRACSPRRAPPNRRPLIPSRLCLRRSTGAQPRRVPR